MSDWKKGTSAPYKAPAVERAARVLFSLAGRDSSHQSLNDICAKNGIYKSKAFAIPETLQGFGLVKRNSEGKGYALGPALIFLSRKALDDLSPPRVAEPILKELAGENRRCHSLRRVRQRGLHDGRHHKHDGRTRLVRVLGHKTRNQRNQGGLTCR